MLELPAMPPARSQCLLTAGRALLSQVQVAGEWVFNEVPLESQEGNSLCAGP